MAEREGSTGRTNASALVSSPTPVGPESDAHADTELLPAASTPARVHLQEAFVRDDGFDSRYERGNVLGRGGMGEVRVCRDHRVGRDVARQLVPEPAGDG